MNGFTLQQSWALLALALVPALALLFRPARRQRDALLRAYGGQRSAEATARSRERWQGEWCVVAATALLALALARPGANPRPSSSPQGGRDVIFVLDVSRSMLGEDVRPSRLERAKADIARCLDSLHNDRVGLVVFAGAAAIRCPLTTDYEFFAQMLKDTSPDSVPRGSTYLELGLEKTTDRMLATNRAGFEDVILLTDGGDQGSHPERTIAALNASGARLLVVGYGDPKIGARVPEGEGDTNGFLIYEGQEVWTRLDEAELQTLTGAATQGKYVHGGTPDFDLGRTYAEWTANAPRQFMHGRSDLKYDEYFGWLLVPALALLLYPFGAGRNRLTEPGANSTPGRGERGGTQSFSDHELSALKNSKQTSARQLSASSAVLSPNIVAFGKDVRGARTALSASPDPPASNTRTRLSALLWLRLRRIMPLRSVQKGAALLLLALAMGQLHAADATNELDRLRAAVFAAANPTQRGERAFALGVALMKTQDFEDAAKAFDAAADGATTADGTAVCRYNEALADAALAAHANDPGAQLNSLDAAVTAMRRACLLRPGWPAAAQGLEVLYARHADAKRGLKTQQEEQNKLDQEASALQKELERLLAEQKKLLAAGTQVQRDRVTPAAEKLATLKTLHTQQADLARQTETVRGKMLSVRDAMRQAILKLNADAAPALPADRIPTGFDEPLEHVRLARAAQDQAAKLLGPLDQVRPAVQAKQQAVNELEAALAALAAGQSGQGDQASDDSDESDMTDSADSDSAASQSMSVRGDFLSDPVNRALPRPNFSSEDILQEEQANAQTRTKNQPARVGKGEKDW